MAIGVVYRVIQNVGGSAKLHNNEVQRLSSPPTSGRASFILPPSAPHTARVFKVIVPCEKDTVPPEFEFIPSGSETVRVVADEARGGNPALMPVYGDNAYVFHEITPGHFMVYRESTANEEGEDMGKEKAVEWGKVDEDGNLTLVNSITKDPDTGAITIGSHTQPEGTLRVSTSYTPAPKSGYTAIPVAGKYEIGIDPETLDEIIHQQYLYVSDYPHGDDSSEEYGPAAAVPVPYLMRRASEGSLDYHIYIPEHSLQYQGAYIEFTGLKDGAGEDDANWKEMDFESVRSPSGVSDWEVIWNQMHLQKVKVWCLLCRMVEDGGDSDSGEPPSRFIARFDIGEEADIAAVENCVHYFAVAEVEKTGTELYEGVTQVASGEMDLSAGVDINVGRVPFGIYQAGVSTFEDVEEPAFGSNASENSALWMFLPHSSLRVGTEYAEIMQTNGGPRWDPDAQQWRTYRYGKEWLRVEPGVYWCVVYVRKSDGGEGSSSGSGGSASQSGSGSDITSGSEPGPSGRDSHPRDENVPMFFATIVRGERDYFEDPNAVFHFKVAEVYEDMTFLQVAFGEVVIDNLPDVRTLVPFQFNTVTYADKKHSLTVYRLFTPREGTVMCDGELLPIAEAEGDWTQIDVPEEYGSYPYGCAIVGGEAHIVPLTDDLYLNADRNYKFPVVAVNVGGDETVVVEAQGRPRAVVVSVERSQIERECTGATKDAQIWRGIFDQMGAETKYLSDREATLENVKSALAWASSGDGMMLVSFSTHGGCDGDGNNCLVMYDKELTDTEMAGFIGGAKGEIVWCVFNACQSGSMAIPSGGNRERFAASVVRKARLLAAQGEGDGVKMLSWSAADDENSAWGNEDGGMFGMAAARHVHSGVSFKEAWDGISTDQELLQWQTPYKISSGGFPEDDKIIP